MTATATKSMHMEITQVRVNRSACGGSKSLFSAAGS